MHALRTAWAIAWRLLVWLVLWGSLAACVVVPLGTTLAGWARLHPLTARIAGDVAVTLGLLLASWVMVRFVDRVPVAAIGLSPRRAARQAAAGIGLGLAWVGASLLAAGLAGCLSWSASGRFSGATLAGAGVALFANVLGQQLLLNGYLLRTLQHRLGRTAGIVLAAALFALAHAGAFRGAWLPAVNVFAAGLLFVLARSASGSLWLPLGVHLAWNGVLGPVLGLTVSGSDQLAWGWRAFTLRGPALLAGGAFGLEGGLLVTLTTAAGVVAFAGRARRARAGSGRSGPAGGVDDGPPETL